MTKDQQADVTGALKAIQKDSPARTLYIQGTATWNQWDGPSSRIEAGAKLTPNFSVFGAGTWDARGPGAELGAKWEWSW